MTSIQQSIIPVKRKGLLAANPLAANPLTSGERHIKSGIKNVLNFKKPAFWFIIIVVVVVCAAVAAFVANLKDIGKEGLADIQLEHTFEIYMVVVPEDGIYHIDGNHIDALQLEKEPVLTDKNLVAYHWGIKDRTDAIEVKDGVSIYERLREKGHKGAGAGMSPFVVVCNGERIYVGVFSSPISSLSVPKYASVYIDAMAAMISGQNIYEILALNDESEKLLHDKRIYNTLDTLGKLKDYSLGMTDCAKTTQ